MAKTSSDKSSRSQHYNSRQQVSSSSKSRRNVEEQNSSMRSRLGTEATQLRMTIFLILAIALTLISIAFFSSNWLEVERRYYGSKFRKLGLWRMCFNSFSAPDDFQYKKFYVGCRWVFAEEYKPIRRYLLPGSCEFILPIIYKHKYI